MGESQRGWGRRRGAPVGGMEEARGGGVDEPREEVERGEEEGRGEGFEGEDEVVDWEEEGGWTGHVFDSIDRRLSLAPFFTRPKGACAGEVSDSGPRLKFSTETTPPPASPRRALFPRIFARLPSDSGSRPRWLSW